MFGKTDHLVGLDIGSACIKVAEVRKSRKGNVLKNFGMIPVPWGAIAEGRIVDMKAVAEAIRTLFQSRKITEKNVAISTGGHSVVIKTISMMKQPEKLLQSTIMAEAEQYIPYDMADINVDYQVLGESDISPDQINVLLVAVRKDLVAEYMNLTAMAGLNARIIDVDTFALQNIYETLPDNTPDDIVLLMDVGASKTSLNILKNGNSMMMRDHVSGTGQIVEEISGQFSTEPAEAESILKGPPEESGDPARLAEIFNDVAIIWCNEISQAVQTFLGNTSYSGITRIIMGGGGVYVPGFAENLGLRLEAEVQTINPFGGLIIDNRMFPPEFITSAGPQAPIALGLALRRVDDK